MDPEALPVARPAGIPRGSRDSLNWLRRRGMVHTPEHERALWSVDWSRLSTPAGIHFRCFIRECSNLQLPIYASELRSQAKSESGCQMGRIEQVVDSYVICHLTEGFALPADCWSILGHIVDEASRITGYDYQLDCREEPGLVRPVLPL